MPVTWEATISYNDLYDRAADLLREFGDGAPLQAAMRADDALVRGDEESRRIWVRVMKIIETIDRPQEQFIFFVLPPTCVLP